MEKPEIYYVMKGHRVCQYFRRRGIEFKPYDLRHAWAARSIQYGLEVSLVSKRLTSSKK